MQTTRNTSTRLKPLRLPLLASALPSLPLPFSFPNAGGELTRWLSGIYRWRRWSPQLFLLALGLRLAGIAVDPFWYDENFTISIIHLPLPQMIAGAVGDVHPPLYYLIVWGLGHLFGYSELVMRLPSAIFVSWACVELYKVMQTIGEREARTGSLIMAVLPGLLNYGQEARNYGLLIMLLLFTFRMVQDGKWRLASLGAALSLYTHAMSIFYLIVIGVLALVKNPRRAVKMGMFAAMAFSPWLPAYARQVGHIDGGYWIVSPTLGAIPWTLWYDTLYNRWNPALAIHAEMFAVVMTALGLLLALRSWRQTMPLIALAVAPPALIMVVSSLWQSVMREPAMLTSAAAVAGLWGIGLVRLTGRDRLAAAAIAVPTMLASIIGYYSSNPTFDWREMTNVIESDWQEGDVIYHMNVASYIQVDQSMRGRSYLLPGSNDLSQNMTDATKDALGIQRVSIETLQAQGFKRAWFIYIQQPLTNEREASFGAEMTARFPVLARYDIYKTDLSDFRIYLLDLRQ